MVAGAAVAHAVGVVILTTVVVVVVAKKRGEGGSDASHDLQRYGMVPETLTGSTIQRELVKRD